MRSELHDSRWRCIRTLQFGVLMLLIMPALLAQELRISSVKLDAQRGIVIEHASNTNFYYVLYSGETVTNLSVAVDLALGVTNQGRLTHSMDFGSLKSRFYRIRQQRVSQPLDTDGDSIDDVWELRFRHPGAALNSADPSEDHNGNGIADYVEYTNNLPVIASFVVAASTVVEGLGVVPVAVRFNKPYKGLLKYQVGGTAVPGRDYEPMQGGLPVNGTTDVLIPVTIKTDDFVSRDRSVVLTLQQLAGPPTYSPANPSTHVLTIVEGDRGVYAGTIVLTNDVLIPPQPVKLAVRSGAGNTGTAFFDTSSGSFFMRRPIILPIQFTKTGSEFVFTAPASALTQSPVLGRTNLTWTLQMGTPLFTNRTAVAHVDLTVSELTASGFQLQGQGTLSLNRLDEATP